MVEWSIEIDGFGLDESERILRSGNYGVFNVTSNGVYGEELEEVISFGFGVEFPRSEGLWDDSGEYGVKVFMDGL